MIEFHCDKASTLMEVLYSEQGFRSGSHGYGIIFLLLTLLCYQLWYHEEVISKDMISFLKQKGEESSPIDTRSHKR